MKKFLFTTFILFTLNNFSQVDRTKVPESGPTPEINLGEAVKHELKNGLKLILVKNDKGKKLGARFLSTFVDFPLTGGKTNLNDKCSIDEKESINSSQIGDSFGDDYVDKLAEITELHNTILSLEKEILGMDVNKKSYLDKKSKLDTLSHVLEKEIVENKSKYNCS